MVAFFVSHPFWPGQVVNPDGTGLKPRQGSVVVKFFASNDYAQVKSDQLKEYKIGAPQNSSKKQRKVIQVFCLPWHAAITASL